MAYIPPESDVNFAMEVNGNLAQTMALPLFENIGLDRGLARAVVSEASGFAQGPWSQSAVAGDRFGAELKDGRVAVDPATGEAYRAFRDAGWGALGLPPDWGGQGMPYTIALACEEMWCAGNMALSLLPMLTASAAAALLRHGSAEVQALFVPKLVSGEWAGAMDMTEPQAGSDLSLIAATARRDGDAYRLYGQKTFITWGEHELAGNIVHLVLARLPDAPQGTRGLSMFVCPKFLPGSDGGLGPRNGVACEGIERKMGIRGSPTCAMRYDGAKAWLVGEENKGLACMFTMMNDARLSVGAEGLAMAQRAFQESLGYAKTRLQGMAGGGPGPSPIARHGDVKRMLLEQKSIVEAERALAFALARQVDLSRASPDSEARARAQRRVDFLIPVVKAFFSDNGARGANLAIQVLGGAGYMVDFGIERLARDARIAPIYEGTNGIQALDFVGRKVARDEGRVAAEFLAEARGCASALPKELGPALEKAADAAQGALEAIAGMARAKESGKIEAVAYPFLTLFSILLCATELGRQVLAAEAALSGSGEALLAEEWGERFLRGKKKTAAFYFSSVLPRIPCLAARVAGSAEAIEAFDFFEG